MLINERMQCMLFFIKRYLYKVRVLRGWLILALFPSIIYLAFKAASPDLFNIYQDISITLDAPIALTTSPTDIQTLNWFSNHQEEFFLDTFTLKTLYNQLNPNMITDQKNNLSQLLINRIKDSMSLTTTKANTAQIKYLGKDKIAGQMFVDFYAKRLLKKAEEGMKREEMQADGDDALQKKALQQPSLAAKKAANIDIIGDIVISEQRALWRQDRLLPAVTLFFIGCIVFLLIIVFIELFDPAFKSERQVAAYLQLPILGAIPNLSKMSQSMGIKSSG